MGATVLGNPAATVITSSPGFSLRSPSLGDVSAVSATRLADDPEFTNRVSDTSRYSAMPASNSSVNRLAVR